MKEQSQTSIQDTVETAGQRKPGIGQRILVVDDEPFIRHLNSEFLGQYGYHVDTADDGATAWEALRVASYDLLITDHNMPRMTVIELIENIRSSAMSIPIIMATGQLPLEAFEAMPWLKPDAMLQRPFLYNDMLQEIRRVLPMGTHTA